MKENETSGGKRSGQMPTGMLISELTIEVGAIAAVIATIGMSLADTKS